MQAACISSEACFCLALAVTPSLLAAWLLFYPLFLHACLKAGSRCFVTWRSQSLREMEPLWAEPCRRKESPQSLFADSISPVQQERRRELIAPPDHNHRSLISACGSYPCKTSMHVLLFFCFALFFQTAGGGLFIRKYKNHLLLSWGVTREKYSVGANMRRLIWQMRRGEREGDKKKENLFSIRSILSRWNSMGWFYLIFLM